MPTQTRCPECKGAKEMHRSHYERRFIPKNRFSDEKTWRDGQLNTDGTCVTKSEALQCRVCWGTGYL